MKVYNTETSIDRDCGSDKHAGEAEAFNSCAGCKQYRLVWVYSVA